MRLIIHIKETPENPFETYAHRIAVEELDGQHVIEDPERVIAYTHTRLRDVGISPQGISVIEETDTGYLAGIRFETNRSAEEIIDECDGHLSVFCAYPDQDSNVSSAEHRKF